MKFKNECTVRKAVLPDMLFGITATTTKVAKRKADLPVFGCRPTTIFGRYILRRVIISPPCHSFSYFALPPKVTVFTFHISSLLFPDYHLFSEILHSFLPNVDRNKPVITSPLPSRLATDLFYSLALAHAHASLPLARPKRLTGVGRASCR